MKRLTVKLLSTLALILASPFVMAAAGDPGTGLTGTPHDFGGRSVAGLTTGTCTFCHTPHKAQDTSLLWNQTATAGTYDWDNLVTTGGTTFATIDATNTGPSAKCLTCHDGTATAGDIGHFNNQDPDTSGQAQVTGNFIVGNGAAGAEMANNHPTSMPYPLNGVANEYNGVTNGPLAAQSDWVNDPTVNNIRMFNDSSTPSDGTGISAGSSAGTSGIECSSCHDPHNGLAAVQDVFFLRGTVGAGANYICAKCHAR